jgi:hypothetical protein
MAQRNDDQVAGTGQPLTTGEFRVAPDASANTAAFQAFAGPRSREAEAPWEMKAPGRSVGRLVGIVLLVAIVLAVIAIIVVNL